MIGALSLMIGRCPAIFSVLVVCVVLCCGMLRPLLIYRDSMESNGGMRREPCSTMRPAVRGN